CRCPACGVVRPAPRAAARLAAGLWEPVCPRCGVEARAMPTPEDLAPDPASVYGATKWQQEILLSTLTRSSVVGGISLRFQNVYGAGQALRNPYTGILPLFVAKGMAGEPMPLYEDGGMTRDFVHVDDAVRAILLALDRPEAPGTVYNVGAGRPVTLREAAREIASALGVPDAPSVTGRYRLGDIRHACADISRASRDLGYRPEVPFADGIRELVAWARTQPTIGSLAVRAEEELSARGLLGQGRV
ncbi:MAG: NAD-dependent epimerase/dehydratase family protein, partial [Planctomycetes bacterium]|nr:NAD-dependent epimerase/dehydratase family protein [Planctomycetota bacterium]